MRALVFKEGLSYRDDYPQPSLNDNEALVRVSCAGICNTDIEITKGYMGFNGILGHEFAGVVEKSTDSGLVGKRVAGEINIGCGTCIYCRSGMNNHCPARSVLGILNKDGAFADYLTLPANNLNILTDSVSDEEAVFVEPLAAAFEILEQVAITSFDKVCVLGDGKLGLLIAQVLSTTGCALITVGKHQEKLSILERMNIRTILAPIPEERRFDIVVDSTGSQSGIETAMRIVKPMGKIILKTTVAGSRPIDLNSIVIDEITVLGSRCGPFQPAIKALEAKIVNVIQLISKVFPIEDGVDAMNYASQKGVIKVILKLK